MRKQINFNALTKQILKQYKEINYDPLEDFYDLDNNIQVKDNIIEEYHLAKMIKAILGIAAKQNIDLNKYFPLFVEI